MSQCPFGNRGLLALEQLLAKHKRFAKRVRLGLHYIVDRPKGSGKRCYGRNATYRGFCALHGATEAEENMRQLCAKRLYKRGNRYLRYIFCRARDYRSTDWRSCTGKGIKANRLERCVKVLGPKLLAKSMRLTKQLKISGSPTWLSNNKRKFSGVNERSIREGYCKDNPKETICKKSP
jgi:hypothetical protein